MPAPCLNLKIFGALRAQIYSSDSHSYNIEYRVTFQIEVSNGINFTIKIDLFYSLKLLSKYIRVMKHSHTIPPLSRETFMRYSPPISQDSPPIQKSPTETLAGGRGGCSPGCDLVWQGGGEVKVWRHIFSIRIRRILSIFSYYITHLVTNRHFI